MPQDYLQDVKNIVDALSRNEEFVLEGRLILLRLMADYIAEAAKKLENELGAETDHQIIN